MIRILLAAAAVIAAMAFEPLPVKAAEAPWCLIGQGGGNGRCTYNSIEECIRDQAGGGSFCNPNPSYHGGEQSRTVRPQPRRRH